jgi:3-hydroxyacyl-[acyl-carrier-protein] dehydratase
MRWMWIDQIIEFEPGRRMVAVKNISLSEDHLHNHFAGETRDGRRLEPMPMMPASLIIEGMAQTAGILVGSVNRFREKLVLAKIVSAQIDGEALPGHTLRHEAELERIDAIGASTRGVVRRLDHLTGEWDELARIELMFSHIDRNMSGLEFPEHNFVFSDNFRMVLIAAGLDKLIDEHEQVHR